MDFYLLKNYEFSNIEQLIKDEVEENIHLDYKRNGALSKEDKKRDEITKDVSAFANSDGGIIIYGLAEVNHKPDSYSFIDGTIYTKEWLENVINTIQPRISGIEIVPIRKDNDLRQTIYIVKIPRSNLAPHMARNHRYYKRFNFVSEPMEDYEVKDVMYRHHSPSLSIINATLEYDDKRSSDYDEMIFSFKCWIKNVGNVISRDYKLSATYFNLPKGINCTYNPTEGKKLPMYICDYCFRISSPGNEIIFPGEIIEMGHYSFAISQNQTKSLDDAFVKLTLYYDDGKKDELLTDVIYNGSLYLRDSEEIKNYIKKMNSDFQLFEVL